MREDVHDRRKPAALGGRLLVLVAAVLWSTSGLFAKATTFEIWPAADRGVLLAFWRAAFAGVLLLPAVRRPQWDVKLIPLCCAFAAMNVTYLSAMTMTTAANAIWLQNTGPVWVFLVGVFILGEKVVWSDWVMLAASGLGVGLILYFELASGIGSAAGIIYALLSGVTYAAVVLHIRVLRREDSAWLIMLNHLVTAVLFAPYVMWVSQASPRTLWPEGIQWPALIAFGALQMGTITTCKEGVARQIVISATGRPRLVRLDGC